MYSFALSVRQPTQRYILMLSLGATYAASVQGSLSKNRQQGTARIETGDFSRNENPLVSASAEKRGDAHQHRPNILFIDATSN